MTHTPLVSVVVNNYNYQRFLGEAIESALSQTYERVEVVVVDDGSTDDSRAIIAAFSDRVRPVLKPNGGQASALNAGFEACEGDLVLFLDADDALDPDAIRMAAEAWRPGVAKIHFSLRAVDSDGRPKGMLHPAGRLESGNLCEAVLERGRYVSPPTSGNLFSRSVLKPLMPIPEAAFRDCPDAYLLAMAALLGEVVSIERPLGSYREHNSNMATMARLDVERLRVHLRSYEAVEDAVREWCLRNDVELPDDWTLRIPNILQSRLGSLLLEPGEHPFANDHRFTLALRGVMASMRHDGMRFRKRLFFAAWFPIAAASPTPIARWLVEAACVRDARPRFLDWLTR